MLIHRHAFRGRLLTCLLLALSLTLITVLSLGSAFRDNDQAALVSGALQVTQHKASLTHAIFYNYDKQWGSYFLLWGLSVLAPGLDPVLRGNVLQVLLLIPALLLVLFALYRSRATPVWTFVPLFLAPALVLYLPFLATASLSLAFLFFSFFALRSGWRWTGVIAIAAATACRGDVVLVAPLIVLSSVPRSSVRRLLVNKLAWAILFAAVAPVFIGKLISVFTFSDLAGFSFNPALFAGFLFFCLGAGVLLLLGVVLFTRLRLAVKCARWRIFYGAEAVALLIPIGFYWSQLYSPRYFFLTLAGLLFVATSRRTAVLVKRVPRLLPAAILTFAIVPWFLGLSLPALRALRPTLTEPTTFPTADGLFPMGAYGAFAAASIREDLAIDHNQKTWESARSVDYRTCGGTVPEMATPMSYYLDVAIRLQGKTPFRVVDVTQAPCGGAYGDLRAVIRHDSTGMDAPRINMEIVSKRPELGRPIVWMANNRAPSPQTQAFRELARYLGGKDAEVFTGTTLSQDPAPGLHRIFFSGLGQCASRIPETAYLCREPEAGEDGWARTVFPDYINK